MSVAAVPVADALDVPTTVAARGRVVFLRDGDPPDGMNTPMLALNESFAAAGVPQNRLHDLKLVRLVGRALGRYRLNRNLVQIRGKAYVVPMAWPNDGRAFPYLYCREIIPWICDCWPRDYLKWEHLFRRDRVKLAFFSARGSAEHFRRVLPGMESLWMPEGCVPSDYSPRKPLAERSIHLLEIGRKHRPFHEAVAGPVAAAGFRHVFAVDGTNTPVYPDQASLHAALGDSVISVCFPRTVTHPDQAGGLETVTLRYFESIASRCIVLGKCPAELEELFGFNPVIEVGDDPAGQVLAILRNPSALQGHVDRAYQRLLEVGTYAARTAAMIRELESRGWACRT
jgi:hypothetical protein